MLQISEIVKKPRKYSTCSMNTFTIRSLPARPSPYFRITGSAHGPEQDFLVSDLVLVGVIFLFLVLFGEQPAPALVGGSRYGGFVFSLFDDSNFIVWA